MSYVDLHLHLLPGVDDGARDQAEAVAYARRMAREGVREATVTPHIRPGRGPDPLEIAARTDELARALEGRVPGVRLRPGGELHPDAAQRLTDRELDAIAQGPPKRRWLLLEAPFSGVDSAFVALCEELNERGFALLIAHPERAAGLLDSGLAALAPARARGALLQVNVCSLLGHHGLAVQETAVQLLRRGVACVLASDAHPGSRGHTQRLGFELALAAGATSVQAWRLTQLHPRVLLRRGIAPAGAGGVEGRNPAHAALAVAA